jgi:hypothetical protein
MSEYFIKVPPDSTGKAIRHSIQLEIDYVNPINPGEVTFVSGEVVIFGTSGVSGTVGLDHFVGGIQHTEPHVHLLLSHGSPETVTLGEDMFVDGVKRAEAGVQTQAFYIPVVQLIGGDNPTHTQSIDPRGAAAVRFDEGSPTFDAFGRMQVSPITTISEHTFNYNGHDFNFSDDIVGTASIVHNSTYGGMVLTTNTGATDSIVRTSDVHNKYIPGQSQLIEMTIAVGDTGKANVRRRWGYFHEDDGIFFELDGTTLNVVMRSSTSGSVVETKIAKSNWFMDKVDGEGGAFNLSGVNLDVSKDNIYWMDVQWLGAGTVRFGVNINGVRIVVHEMHHANIFGESYMRTGSLPTRVEQTNTGVAASVSQMKFFCSVVKTEGKFDPQKLNFSYVPLGGGSPWVSEFTVSNTLIPLFSIRPTATFKGLTNGVMILPSHMSLSAFDNATPTNAERIVIEIYRNASLTGDSWGISPNSESAAEIDATATTLSGGKIIGSIIAHGVDAQDIDQFFDYVSEHLINKHNGTHNTYTFAARTIRQGVSADVLGTLSWNEIRD